MDGRVGEWGLLVSSCTISHAATRSQSARRYEPVFGCDAVCGAVVAAGARVCGMLPAGAVLVVGRGGAGDVGGDSGRARRTLPAETVAGGEFSDADTVGVAWAGEAGEAGEAAPGRVLAGPSRLRSWAASSADELRRDCIV